jgi:hypothetical protein
MENDSGNEPSIAMTSGSAGRVGKVEGIDQVEEFFGPGRTSADLRRQGWFSLLFFTAPGLFFFSMLWWGEPTVVTNIFELLYHFAMAKVLPLVAIVFGVVGAVVSFREGSNPEVETLWYRLDRSGLHILNEHAKRSTLSEIAALPGETGALIGWSTIKSPIEVLANPPRVRFTRRSPGAVIDRTVTLFAGQRSVDRAAFEDRLKAWLAVMQAGQPA